MLRHSLTCLLLTLAFVSQPALGASTPFALYGTTFLEELTDGGNQGKINLRFQPGPFTWTPASSLGPLDGWDVNADGLYSYSVGSAEVLSDNFFLQDIQSDMTLNARDAGGNVLGTIRVSGVGKVAADFDTSRTIVDDDMGAIIFRYGFPLDDRSFELGTVTEATGIYSGVVDLGEEWVLRYAGFQGRVLVPGVDPQEAIFANPSFGLFSTFMITNVPEPNSVVLLGIALLVSFGCALFRKR